MPKKALKSTKYGDEKCQTNGEKCEKPGKLCEKPDKMLRCQLSKIAISFCAICFKSVKNCWVFCKK